jgi:hypothetical protein
MSRVLNESDCRGASAKLPTGAIRAFSKTPRTQSFSPAQVLLKVDNVSEALICHRQVTPLPKISCSYHLNLYSLMET